MIKVSIEISICLNGQNLSWSELRVEYTLFQLLKGYFGLKLSSKRNKKFLPRNSENFQFKQKKEVFGRELRA